jgi:hypothetical protein
VGGSPGTPATLRRGPTARNTLKIAWDFPVYVEPVVQDAGPTQATRVRQALTREDALRFVAAKDPRPLLVLRDGTDDALLKDGEELTYLLASWFHCVKLPADVLEEDHPFHALFLQEQPEHLFVSSADGANHDPLESQTSRTELWDSMRAVLAGEYKKSPETAIKGVTRILDKMDQVDSRWNELVARRDNLLEKEGPGAKDLVKLQRELQGVEKEREKLREEMAQASRLELKRRAAQPAEAGASAPAGS